MTIFLTADTHFGHAGMLYNRMHRPRPFASIEEHDESLIAVWNGRVRPDDQVWHLGDFAYGATFDRTCDIFNRLNGVKHLILGNHDRCRTTRLPWASQQNRTQFTDRGLTFVVDRYSMRTRKGAHHGVLYLYGHSR